MMKNEKDKPEIRKKAVNGVGNVYARLSGG